MFTKTKDSADAVAQNQPAGRRPSRSAPSLISQDMHVSGAMTAAGDIQVDGKVEGDITSGSLTIGEKANVAGDIMAEEVIVRGRVIGSIRARKVQLCSTAHVEGDIFHQALAVETGAYFEGNCRHSEDPLKEKTNAPKPTSGSREREGSGRRIGTGPAPRPDSAPPAEAPPTSAAQRPQAVAAPIQGPGPGGPAGPRAPGGMAGRPGPLHLGRRPEAVPGSRGK